MIPNLWQDCQGIAQSWLKIDEKDALNWIDSLEGKSKDSAYRALIHHLGKYRFIEAAKRFVEIQDKDIRQYTFQWILMRMVNKTHDKVKIRTFLETTMGLQSENAKQLLRKL